MNTDDAIIERFDTREEWLRARRKGIGGSDAAVLAGKAKHSTPLAIWAEKREGWHRDDDRAPDDIVAGGHELQEPIAQWWAKIAGAELVDLGDLTIVRSPEWPIASVSIDYLAKMPGRPGLGVVEVKLRESSVLREFRNEATPDAFRVQVEQGQYCTGAQWGVVVCFVAGHGLVARFVDRDPARLEHLIEKVERPFWDLVESGVPPAPTDHDVDGEYLLDRFLERAHGAEHEVVMLSDADAILVDAFVGAREAAGTWEKERKRLKNELEALAAKYGDTALLGHPDGRVVKLTRIHCDARVTPVDAYDYLRIDVRKK